MELRENGHLKPTKFLFRQQFWASAKKKFQTGKLTDWNELIEWTRIGLLAKVSENSENKPNPLDNQDQGA